MNSQTKDTLMDKQLAKVIHDDLIAALDAVSKKYKLTRGKSRMSYSADGFKLQADFQTAGGRTKEQIQYDRYAHVLGLPKLGTRFQYRADLCETYGLLVGGPYKTLLWKNLSNGKIFKLAVDKAQQACPDLKVSRVAGV
jgi:hypothetical protein